MYKSIKEMFKFEGDYRALYFLFTKLYIFSIHFVFYLFFCATTIRFCAILQKKLCSLLEFKKIGILI